MNIRFTPSADSMSDLQMKAESVARSEVMEAKRLLVSASGRTGLYRDVIFDALDILPTQEQWERAVDDARNG